MRERIIKKNFTDMASAAVDNFIEVISPRRAFQRKAFRFAYEAIDNHRTRKKRGKNTGTGDRHLDETTLSGLREIARDMCRNNPIAIGLLKTERDGVIGSGPKIQARTEDTGWNEEVEAAWDEEMEQKPCDVTGRMNFSKLLQVLYLSYRRDGDAAAIYTDGLLQGIEGEQIGTPYGLKEAQFFEVVNGVAYSKETGRVIGYYIGKPNKWGYIQGDSVKKYLADFVYHMFNPDRFSFSRGEPALTQSIKYLDYLSEYVDAELVAAKVNACFSAFISKKDVDLPDGYTHGISSSGYDEENNRLEKLEPGTIFYGEPGESVTGIGQTRPGGLFDPFVQRMLTIIGRPLCMPLMLITLDFSGATFMNARIAYQKVQEAWQEEQNFVVKPFVSRTWLWKVRQLIDSGKISDRDDWFRHEIICNRWPYVDPYKEAIADEQQLINGTTTRTKICDRQGDDFVDILIQRKREEDQIQKEGLSDIITSGRKTAIGAGG